MKFKIGKINKTRRQFNILGFKGFIAYRKLKSRGWGKEITNNFCIIHLGKKSLYFKTSGKTTGKGFGN